MGFFSEAGPLQVFVSNHLIPEAFEFNTAHEPCYQTTDGEQKIVPGSEVRLRIVGTRVDASDIVSGGGGGTGGRAGGWAACERCACRPACQPTYPSTQPGPSFTHMLGSPRCPPPLTAAVCGGVDQGGLPGTDVSLLVALQPGSRGAHPLCFSLLLHFPSALSPQVPDHTTRLHILWAAACKITARWTTSPAAAACHASTWPRAARASSAFDSGVCAAIVTHLSTAHVVFQLHLLPGPVWGASATTFPTQQQRLLFATRVVRGPVPTLPKAHIAAAKVIADGCGALRLVV